MSKQSITANPVASQHSRRPRAPAPPTTTPLGRLAEDLNAGAKARQLRAQALRLNTKPTVIQRVLVGGQQVQADTPYANDNEDEIMTHMAGEWGRNNAGAVTGGHLLTRMVATWGQAVANSDPGPASPRGVHFASHLPPTQVSNVQRGFKLVHVEEGGQRRISALKNSTFWPRAWTTANLRATLNDSHRCGAATEYASKANETYWYRWQTLGDNTLFPIARYAAEG